MIPLSLGIAVRTALAVVEVLPSIALGAKHWSVWREAPLPALGIYPETTRAITSISDSGRTAHEAAVGRYGQMSGHAETLPWSSIPTRLMHRAGYPRSFCLLFLHGRY